MSGLKSYVGHRIRELKLHAERLVAPRRHRPRVLVLLNDMWTGGPGDLRGIAIARELRRLGWRAFAVPPQCELSQRRRIIRLERPDVILLQQALHPLNRPSLCEGVPCVLDADDADILDPKCNGQVIECLEGSRAAIAGNHWLAERFRQYNADVSVIWTGNYIENAEPNRPPAADGLPIVAWASSGPSVFPAESDLIRQMVFHLARTNQFALELYGMTPGPAADAYMESFRAPGVVVRSFPRMKYVDFVATLKGTAVGLQPVCVETSPFSQGKSFGKILAYLAADVATVNSDAVDHPLFFRNGENGMLVANDPAAWATAVKALLDDPALRARIAAQGRVDFRNRLTTAKAAALVDPILRRAAGITAPAPAPQPQSVA